VQSKKQNMSFKTSKQQIFIRQGRRKLRLIPAGLTSFDCRRWNTNPNEHLSPSLATKLPLYMLQISLVSVSLLLDKTNSPSLATEPPLYLLHNSPFLLLLSPFSFFLFFFFPLFSSSALSFLFFLSPSFLFNEGFHLIPRIQEKNSPLYMAGGSFI